MTNKIFTVFFLGHGVHSVAKTLQSFDNVRSKKILNFIRSTSHK